MTGTQPRFVAVIDIGKTNAKVALHDLASGTDGFVATIPNTVLPDGPYPHFDTEGLWRFVLSALADCAADHAIDAICVTTHGASATLVDDETLVLPILDYESPGPEETRRAYDRLRPPFAETYSPRLPNGLNVGAQLFWQETTFPEAFAKARHILFYPQYWVWRLTGIAATEVTSIGCHTDLWRPAEGRVSSLAAERGWDRLLPPMRSAFDAVGILKPDLARRIGLRAGEIPVHCGIHDSNASLLPHLLSRAAPFTVLSTGTWIIALAVGGALEGLDPERDTLVNVDALGRPVPSARFMGGREFDILTRKDPVAPSPAELAAVIEEGIMVLPSFAPGTGPMPKGQGRWTAGPDSLSPGMRTAAASLYCALMTTRMLEILGAGGPTVVEGPFARNELFLDSIATLTARAVVASANATGTTAGSALLATDPGRRRPDRDGGGARRESRADPALSAYAERWRRMAEG